MEIKYCDNCNAKIGLNDTSAGPSEDGRVFCSKCGPLFKFTTTALQKVVPPIKTIGDEVTGEYAAVKEPAAAPSVTKFYFCETCGKRITDRQILEGLGRDKKLKGVYCKDCAVGVMTMEMDAVNIAQLATAKPKTPSPPSSGDDENRPLQRKASGTMRAQNVPQRQLSGRNLAGGNADRFPVLPAIGAASIIGIIFAVVAMQQQAAPLDRAGQTLQTQAFTKPLPSPDAIPPSPPVKTMPEQPQAVPVPIASEPVVPESNADAPSGSPKKLPPVEKTRPDQPIAPVQPIEPVALPATEATPPEPVAQPAVVAPIDKGQEQLANVLKELAPLLRLNQYNDAERLLDEKLHDPALAGISERLKGEKADLAEIRTLRQRAFGALRAKKGSIVTLKILGKTMTGTVKDNPNHIDLALVVRDGPEMSIRPDQLDVQDVDAYAPVETGIAKTEYLRRRGLLFLAACDTVKAEDCFTKAREAGLGDAAAPYLERIAALKLGDREAAALDAWKKAEKLFANKAWNAARQAYETLQRDYTGSAALANNAEMLNKRLETIDQALGPPKELSLNLGGDVKLELVLIPAGEFEMGSNDGEKIEKPVHKVKISRSFYMGKYVVTQAQFEKVTGNNRSNFKGETLPVEMVSYNDADEFCKKASKITGKSIRLPTEAEWEYACRSGTNTAFNTGDNASALEQAGWFNVNSGDKTHPVGQKMPNAWGLYDMHGNVSQLCQDWFAGEYYSKAPAEDPQGPERGTNIFVTRGGSWNSNSMQCRSSHRSPRFRNAPENPNEGFRVMVIANK